MRRVKTVPLWVTLILVAAISSFAVACGGDDDKAGGGNEVTLTPVAEVEPLFECDSAHPGTTPDATEFPLQITDDAGSTITLNDPPSAIASLSAGHTEVLYAIGAGDQVTAVDRTSDCPAATADLPQMDAFSPNVEAITALAPDLVIIFFDPGDLATSLTSAGIPVMTLDSPTTVDGVYDQIELLGQVTGHVTESEALVTGMISQVDAITANIDGTTTAPSVFHELDNTFFTAGPGSFIGDLYAILGAENIANATGEAYPQMSQEAIIQANPAVIILADEEAGESAATVAARPGWTAISAVQTGRIHAVDPDIVSRPGPRIVDALRLLASFLYP